MRTQTELPKENIKTNKKRMSELIYEQISDWIMDGTLAPGQRINEDELAETFGVSRMPIREAMRIMCEKGLMQNIPYIGSSVRKLSDEEVVEVYILRSVLEPFAGQLSALNITQKQLTQLRKIQMSLEEYGAKPISFENRKQMYMLNREFHLNMYQSCGMERLIQMIESLWDSIAYLNMRTSFNPKYSEQMKQAHQRYMYLLEQRKGDELSRYLEENLRRHVGSFNILRNGLAEVKVKEK